MAIVAIYKFILVGNILFLSIFKHLKNSRNLKTSGKISPPALNSRKNFRPLPLSNCSKEISHTLNKLPPRQYLVKKTPHLANPEQKPFYRNLFTEEKMHVKRLYDMIWKSIVHMYNNKSLKV